ncbi:PucR family transcriptional regulator [Paenibacillus sediminis]|uniref:Purine catabolism regulator n=1 Tax=Paenibacillus sediminis TaxID=664909 RepID=A0ABS4H2M0_9BACL|nr:PucR family transcriptional regulator [Paenibacillus sediminis]MBP1936782.1 purine catabolism regulator [Paenibacillus sediminis]
MDGEYILTVGDVLKRPLFQDAYLVAGEKGLHRRIRWVHILEISNVEALLYGEEMIMTTGIVLKAEQITSTSYLQKMINWNVSCLCIELGPYFDSVPQQMIELANEYDFPIIVFPHSVRFVDITQDLHSLIVNRHHELLQKLEGISREFHRLTLSDEGISQVLRLLHQSTSAQILFVLVEGQQHASFIPHLHHQQQERLLGLVREQIGTANGLSPNAEPYTWKAGNQTFILQAVGALGKTWAYIIMALKEEPGQYHYLILDSATLSIAQALLRERYIEERKLYTENLWVDELLQMRLKDEEQLKSLMGPNFKKLNDLSHQVCIIQFEHMNNSSSSLLEGGHESLGIRLSLILRPIFEQHSFHPLITLKNNQLVVIGIDLNPKRPAKGRLQHIFESLNQTVADHKIGHFKLIIGVGNAHHKLIHAHLSYEEAVQALSLYPAINKPVLFFEELGVFQLLFNIHDRSILEAFIHNYLGPLIEHDQMRGSELLRTLKVYLDHDGSKQIAAQKLFIVRQSLYYRLEKVTELLGEDFMLPENRLALQVALRACQMLYPELLSDKEK